MTESAEFWNKIADKYAKSPVKDAGSYQRTLDHTRTYLKPDAQVLELGCGTGSTALLLADAVKHITATDISVRMLEIAQQKADVAKASNLTFVHSQSFEQNNSDVEFDIVLAFNYLHLIENLPAELARIRKRLKVGGVFISKTACLGKGKWLYAPLITVMRWFGKAPFVSMLTAIQLETALKDAGFEIIDTATYPTKTGLPFIVARRAGPE